MDNISQNKVNNTDKVQTIQFISLDNKNSKLKMVKYIQNYALYESIGSGVYGKVYRAINNNDKKQYAVKVIPIVKFRENKKLQQCTVNQINILTNIEANQHIIKYFDMLKTSNNFYFIYEYCNGGTLEGLLSKQGKLSQQSALLIFKQILEAFQVLNKYNIMHRDLKPDNIFFHNGIIKLGDFGFCKNLSGANQMARTMLGSPIYMAPQVLKGQIYSNKADIWSLGVVVYEMIFGHCPFQSNTIAKLIQVLNTKQIEFPDVVSSFLGNLIQRMLTKDPQKRIGWMELFQIKITNQGLIQNQKIKSISSLNDAKFSDQHASLVTTKYTPAVGKQGGQQQQNVMGSNIGSQQTAVINQTYSQNHSQSPPNQYQSNQVGGNDVNFKKTRPGQSTPATSNNSISNNSQISQNSQQVTAGGNYISPLNSQVSQQGSSNSNPNIPVQSNQQTHQMQLSSKISQQHRMVLDGVKLAMEIIDSRIPNYSGYAHLVLSKNVSNLENLLQRPFRKEIIEILDKELKDMKSDRDFVTSKMYSYQLKGLDDWKKYMRGKFFEEQKTISLWFRMITFLNGSQPAATNLSTSQMAESVKSILY